MDRKSRVNDYEYLFAMNKLHKYKQHELNVSNHRVVVQKHVYQNEA